MNWGLILWTLLLLGPLLWLVQRVHQELQALFFLLTNHRAVAVYLFQILLLPGVILHELSHFLAASLLGVRVRHFSLRPEIQGEKIQMGAVVIDKPDFMRGLLIGLAPLILGSVAVVLIGQQVFDVGAVIEAARVNGSQGILQAVQAAFRVNDAWIWLYLIFAISNAMLPSQSDRESLGPVATFIAAVVATLALAGLGPKLMAALTEPMEQALSLLLMAFGITLFVDVVFVAIILALRGLVSLLTGRRLERIA